MERYAANKMELAPRDVISRAEQTEILEGRGIEGSDGIGHVWLDLTHLGAERINKALPLIREVTMKFLGLDPITEPIPVRPVAHYSMGGVEADITGRTRVANVWAAGEVACHSLHGANRLGSNSTAECLVWGGICGQEVVKFLANGTELGSVPQDQVAAEEKRLFEEIPAKSGKEDPYAIRRELRAMMQKHMGVFRTGELMEEGLRMLADYRRRFADIHVKDSTRFYNTNLFHVLELENLLDLAEVMLKSGLARTESRGAHSRRDFTERNDEQWLKHTLMWQHDGAKELDYKPVAITKWQPIERKY